jgi:hypothetical protein
MVIADDGTILVPSGRGRRIERWSHVGGEVPIQSQRLPPEGVGRPHGDGEAAFLVGQSLPSILSNPKVDRRAHARRTVWAIAVDVLS